MINGKGKKALITGSHGFVGRKFCEKLFNEGWTISLVDIVDPNNPIDARDFFRYDDTHYDLVVHLAAVVGGRVTIEGAPLSVAVDLAIDSEAFQWALRTKPKHFVYYSSSAAYPIYLQEEYDGLFKNEARQKEDWIDLDDIANPDLTYGWSKLTGEMLARHAQDAGVRVHVFRPFSGYGTEQALGYPFPDFLDRARRKVPIFDIWGTGEQTRDWIHIDDIVNATMEAIEQDVQGPVNLCTGIPTNFNDLADMVTKAAGYTPKFNHILTAPKGVHYRVGDPTKMNTFYTPKITIEEGIHRALQN